MKKLNSTHFRFKLLLIILLTLFLAFHLLVSFGIIPYESLWGTTVTGQVSLVRAEAFAICFIVLFLLAAIFENSAILSVKKISNVLLIICAIYMVLNFFGYLRCDNTALKILMSIYTIVMTAVTILLLIVQRNLNRLREMNRQ